MKIDSKLLKKIVREELTVQAISDTAGEDKGEVFGDGGTARMVRSQLFRISKFAQSLHDKLSDSDELPEWLQSKVAAMVDDMDEVHGHLDHKMHTHNEDSDHDSGAIDSVVELIANLHEE